MDTYLSLKSEIVTEANKLRQAVDDWQQEMLAKVEEIKDNEILVAIKAINSRLDQLDRKVAGLNPDEIAD